MNTLRRIILLVAFLWVLSSMAVSVFATEPEISQGSCGIAITLKYLEDGEIDDGQPLDAYRENVFRLTDSSGWYLQAEFNAADGCYHVTGWTLEESAASLLQCGQSPEEPGRVAIVGLFDGAYFLTQLEATRGFWGLCSPLKIFLSTAGASLNGDPCPMNDDSIVSFCVLNSPSFRMPATCRWCELQYALQDGMLTVETVVITALFTFAAVKIYCAYRAKKYAKTAFGTMLVSLLVPVSLLILCLAGVLSFTHRIGPVIGTLSGAAYGIYFIAAVFLVFRKK